MKKKWLAALLIYAALVMICLVVVYAVPSIRGMLEKTYIAEYGKLDVTDSVSGYIVRDERVYVAGQDSEIERLAEPDNLVKAKTRIVELTPIEKDGDEQAEGEEEYSGKYGEQLADLVDETRTTEAGETVGAGYVSYYIDGAEAKLSTSQLDNLKRTDYEELTSRKRVETPGRKCSKGDPVFKIVRNKKWYLVYYIDKKDGEKYYEGRTVSIELNEKQVPATVARVEFGKKTAKITLSCKTFYEGFLETRTLDTTVTVASADGLLLKDSSIVEKDGQKGVFVKNKLGEHKFKPIAIKADDGENCVVYSDIYVDAEGNYVETLATYDEIVEEPTEEDLKSLEVKEKK